MSENEIIVNNGKLFKKSENTQQTWVFYHKLEFLKDNYRDICLTLQNKYKFQLEGVDLYDLMLSDLNTAYAQIKQTPNLIIHDIIHYNIIEFKDGLYFMDEDYFFNYYKNKNIKALNLN